MGMDRIVKGKAIGKVGKPHMRGDGPKAKERRAQKQSKPHMRGDGPAAIIRGAGL